MSGFKWKSPRIAWLGVGLLTAAAFKVVATAALGFRFDPALTISAVAVALCGGSLVVLGFGTGHAKTGELPTVSRDGPGLAHPPRPGAAERAVRPTALVAAMGMSLLVFSVSVATHVLALIPGTELSLERVWPVLLTAVAAPYAAGLAWIVLYRAVRDRTVCRPDALQRRMIDDFWSTRVIAPVLLALSYAVLISLATCPATGDVRPISQGDEHVVPVPGGVRALTAEEHRAAVAHEIRVKTGAAVAFSLWGVLAMHRLWRHVRFHPNVEYFVYDEK